VAFSLLAGGERRLGMVYGLLVPPVAWARIYLGVHFPFDMLGALVVGAISAGALARFGARVVDRVLPWLLRLHAPLFKRWIAKGWVRA
jgi:undecaprenyl-diphosphatase